MIEAGAPDRMRFPHDSGRGLAGAFGPTKRVCKRAELRWSDTGVTAAEASSDDQLGTGRAAFAGA